MRTDMFNINLNIKKCRFWRLKTEINQKTVLRIRDVYTGSQILDLTTTKEEGKQNLIYCPIFFCHQNFHKIEKHYNFNRYRTNLPN